MDITHHYIKKGQGAPMLLLHGNGEEGGCFARQLEFFSRFYTVYAIDTRGHGKTPRGSAPFTIKQFSEDIHCFIAEHEIKNPIILGFSDGANIAMEFAMKYPDEVSCLILNGGNLCPTGMTLPVLLQVYFEYICAIISRNKHKKELMALMIKEPHISASQLGKITVPTLVIAGNRDMIRRKHTHLIAASIPNAREVIIPGNHFIAYNSSEAFNDAVLEFLRGTG